MKFDINNYKGKYVMHCKTKKEAENFYDYMHNIGKPIKLSLNYIYGKNVYYFKKEYWSSIKYAKTKATQFLNWRIL